MDAEGRARNVGYLADLGFQVASTLPTERGTGGLRSAPEIAARLCALDLVFTWVVYEAEQVPDAKLRDYESRSSLAGALTASERELWELPRSDAHQYRETIGWRLENEWPLAWALGFDPVPPVSGDMIPQPMIERIVKFLPKLDDGVEELLERSAPRTEAEVDELEDLFYCAHNAARSAQLGGKTVPDGFDPVLGGGVIHERRHALSWCVSPEVAWDDVDLST